MTAQHMLLLVENSLNTGKPVADLVLLFSKMVTDT